MHRLQVSHQDPLEWMQLQSKIIFLTVKKGSSPLHLSPVALPSLSISYCFFSGSKEINPLMCKSKAFSS